MPERCSDSTELPVHLSRTVDLFGREPVWRLRRALVVVAGLGGVGSHAALALARSGVGRLRLVDFDQVTASSLNRHAVAVAADVGQSKAQVVARAVTAIDPEVEVEPLELFVDAETVDQVLASEPRFLIDAIDSLNPKVTLLRRALELSVPVASSMGAAGRLDPTELRLGPLDQTAGCPLARAVRKRLRRQGVELERVTAVSSAEPPSKPLPPDEEDPRLERGRVRNRQPSLAVVPGAFGYALASVVLREVAGGQRGE